MNIILGLGVDLVLIAGLAVIRQKGLGETVLRFFSNALFLVLGVLLIVMYLDIKYWSKPEQVSFQTQLAEQNRQAEVASELRAAEVGDFAVMRNDEVLLITLITSDGDIALCRPIECKPSHDRISHESAKRRVQHIVKLYGNDVELLQTARRYAEGLKPKILQR